MGSLFGSPIVWHPYKKRTLKGTLISRTTHVVPFLRNMYKACAEVSRATSAPGVQFPLLLRCSPSPIPITKNATDESFSGLPMIYRSDGLTLDPKPPKTLKHTPQALQAPP